MRPLRVLYDFEVFSDQPRGGITRYVLSVAERLARSSEVSVFAGFHRSEVLREQLPSWARGWYFAPLPRTGELRRRVNALLTHLAVHRFRPDIVHRTYYHHVVHYSTRLARVTTIHDFTDFVFPDKARGSLTIQKRIKDAVWNSDHLIFVSENTRRDARRFLGGDSIQSTVVPLGVDQPLVPAAGVPANLPYLLFVGLRSGYKDFSRVLEALASEPKLRQFSLVAFGGGPFSIREARDIANRGLQHRVRHQFGDDHALAQAYANATALVYPSLYEGFGLPVLEAMAHSCPVVCSDAASLPEVAGDAAEYFSAANGHSLCRALSRVGLNNARQEELRRIGLGRSRKFTWDTCAEKTLTAYHTLIEQRRGRP